MGRELRIRELGTELLETKLKDNLAELQYNFLEHRDSILEELQNSMTLLCQSVYDLQQQERKGSICFLSFSYLRRCVYTKNHEIRIDLYNKDFYFDPQKVYSYWNADFIFRYFENDMSFFKDNIRMKLPLFQPLQEYEEKEFALWYIRHYYKIAEVFIQQQSTAVIENAAFCQMDKTDIQISYGGYMEEHHLL